jgi:hypothetical protein
MRDWFKGKTYAAENEQSFSRKCTYEITNVRVECGNIWPTVILDVKIHTHYLRNHDERWVKLSKPGGHMLRRVNYCMRSLILEDKRMELSMFDISKNNYMIKVGTVKWVLKK